MAREPRGRSAVRRGRGRGGRGHVSRMTQETPGVNKIKSLLRQTKRLLSRESLPPGVRIEAERKCKALERDLEERTQSNKERTMAARYHKKLVRRIRQCKRSLATAENAKPLRTRLFESRVFLNYVLRYVALFAEHKDPVAPDAQSSDRAQVQAAEFLATVRKSMKRGEMSAEPEMELERRQATAAEKEEEAHEDEEDDEEDVDEEDVDEEDVDEEDDDEDVDEEDDDEDVDEEDDDEDVDEDDDDDANPTNAAHSLAQDDFFAL